MHKKTLLICYLASLSLAIPVPILAQAQAQPQNQMQNNIPPEMMQNMAEMQNCMMQIDYQEMAQMEQKSMQLETQMRDHCANGNEDAAKVLALEFSDEVMNSNTMKAMKKCAAMMPGMEDQLKVPDFRQQIEEKSICEFINNNSR